MELKEFSNSSPSFKPTGRAVYLKTITKETSAASQLAYSAVGQRPAGGQHRYKVLVRTEKMTLEVIIKEFAAKFEKE